MKVAEEREEERKVSKAIINYANNYNTHNIINNIHVNNREGISKASKTVKKPYTITSIISILTPYSYTINHHQRQ